MFALLILAAALSVDPKAGNSKFDAIFDAPLGEKIDAMSSKVGCSITYGDGAAEGSCSVPLTSITVDNEPTKAEHFQQWATNKKSDPKKCRIEATFSGVKADPPALTDAESKLSGEAAFTICGRARADGGKEKLTGTAMKLADGRIRIRVHVEKFNRESYQIGPKWTSGWLGRVQQLAPVVAAEGSLDISVFADEAKPSK